MEPLTLEQRDAYLERIGLDAADLPGGTAGGEAPDASGTMATVETVAALQLAHLRTVPFENLDIHLGRAIVLDPERIYAKVVGRRRGGYCYELNSLFARLLASFGLAPSMVSAQVARDGGTFGAPFDHLALLVRPTSSSAGEAPTVPHLVDVGFGDAFTRPIALVDGAAHDDRDRRVRVRLDGAAWCYEEDRGDGWVAGYRFTTTPHDLAAFAVRNVWQQSSPDSNFTRQIVATRITDAGRITVSGGPDGDRLIATALDRTRTERPLAASELLPSLSSELGIDLPGIGPTFGPALEPALDEIDPAILANPVATLATNGPDGRPQLTAIWYCVEDGAICMSAAGSTQKVRNLRRDRRCTVMIFDPVTPSRYVEIRGAADIEDDADYRFADRLGRRYDADFRIFDTSESHRFRLVVRPTRIVITDVRG